MADVVINIKALDLTKGAVDSAKRSLRSLTSLSRVDSASSAVGSAFRNLAKDVERYQKMSAEALRKEIRERRSAINTMVAMEARFRLHLLKQVSDADKASTQKRMRSLAIHKSLLQREIAEAGRALRAQEQMEKKATRDKERELKARERFEKQLRMRTLAAAKSYNAKILAEDMAAAKKRQNAVAAVQSAASGVAKGAKRMAFNAIFAGSVVGSQASMLGSQLGGALGGIGGTLSGGITSLLGLGQKTIRILTQAASLAVKVATTISSLYVNILTGLVGTFTAFFGTAGLLVSGFVTGIGNALSGGIRMVGDLVSGSVELVGGMIEGLFNTVTNLASEILKGIAAAVGQVFEFVGGILSKVGGMVGQAFGMLLETGISTFETMMGKIAEFRDVMADVFTQVPEIGQKGFDQLLKSVEGLSDKLPISKKDLAKGLFEIVSTQLTSTPEEAIKVLTATSRAAIAGGHEADVVETTKAATAVMSAFNLKAEEAEVTLSKLMKAAVLGRFSFKDLAEGIQNVSGIAANFETSLDDMLTAYVLASQSMAKGTVPTAVKNLILSLAAPTREAGKALDAAKVSLKTYTAEEEDNLNTKRKVIAGLEQEIEKYVRIEKKTTDQKNALRDMRAALRNAKSEYADASRAAGHFVGVLEGIKRIQAAGLSPAQLREAIPERRALAAATAIMSAMDREPKTAAAIRDDNGQQIQTAMEIRKGVLKNQLGQLSNIWENTWNRMYDFVVPIIGRVVDTVSKRLFQLRKAFSEAFTEEGLAGLADVIGTAMEKAVNYVFDGVEWIIQNWDKILVSANEVWGGVKTVAEAAWNAIKFGYEAVAKALGGQEKLGQRIKQAFDDAINGARGLYAAIQQIADGNMEPIIGLIDTIKIKWAELTDFMRSQLANALSFAQGPINEISNQIEDTIGKMQHPVVLALSRQGPRELAKNRAGGIKNLEGFFSPSGAIAQLIGKTVNPGGAIARGLSPADVLMGKSVVPGDATDEQIVELLTQIKDGMLAEGKAGGKGVLNTYSGDEMARKVAAAVKEKFGRGGITDYNFGEVRGGMTGDLKYTAEELASALQTIRQASAFLEGYGYKPGEEQDKAFGDKVDFTKVIDGLKEAQAPAVKAQVEADAAQRESQAAAIRQRDEIIKLLGGGFNIGFPGPQGPLGETGPKMPSKQQEKVADALEGIEDNTEDAAEILDADSGVQPQSGDDEHLLNGKLPRAPLRDKAMNAAQEVLSKAIDLESDKRPEKPKKAKKAKKPHRMNRDEVQALKPGWWPDEVGFGNQDYNRHDLIKLRKSYNRDQNNKQFNPFGNQGMFGFHKGPGHPTLGAPRRDKDGRIIGFQDFQGPQRYAPRRGPEWTTPEGKTPGDLYHESRDRYDRSKKAKKDREAKDEARRLSKMTPEKQAEKIISDIPALGDIFGNNRVPEGKEGGFGDGLGKEVDPNTATPPKPTEVKANVEETKAKLTEQNSQLGALASALQALYDAQGQAADGAITFSTSQVNALSAVGISMTSFMNAVKENNGKVLEIIATLKDYVTTEIEAIKQQTRAVEANKGL